MTKQGKNAIDVLLAEALKELAAKRPIEKITIKEITDKAGVIRPTFYNHFQDKYELMEWIITNELLDPIYPLISNGMVTEAMVLLFTNIQKDRVFYTKAVKMDGVITFSDVANKCVVRVLEKLFAEQCRGRHRRMPWLTTEVVASYYGQTMCFAMREGVKTGMNESQKKMAEAYTYMFSHSREEVMKEF